MGFIQKLPTQLVAAFRATLEEIGDASLLLHLVDCRCRVFSKTCLQALYPNTLIRCLVRNTDRPNDEPLHNVSDAPCPRPMSPEWAGPVHSERLINQLSGGLQPSQRGGPGGCGHGGAGQPRSGAHTHPDGLEQGAPLGSPTSAKPPCPALMPLPAGASERFTPLLIIP